MMMTDKLYRSSSNNNSFNNLIQTNHKIKNTMDKQRTRICVCL